MGVLYEHPQVLSNDLFRKGTSNVAYFDPNEVTLVGSGHRRSHLPYEVPKPFSGLEDDTSSNSSGDENSGSEDDTQSIVSSNTSYSGESVADDTISVGQQRPVRYGNDSGYFALEHDFETQVRDVILPQLKEEGLECPSVIDLSHGQDGEVKLEPTTIHHRPTRTHDIQPQVTEPVQHQPHAQAPVQPPTARNRCRRRSCESSGVQPPRLKRDTDSADAFVNLLIAFTCRLVTAIWPLAATPPMMTACFNGAGVLPLHTFIYETLRRSKTSYSTLQIALYYLVMLKPKLPGLDFTKEQPGPHNTASAKEAHGCRAMQCGRRMFLSALMLASKYIQDRNYSTRAWSKISGLRIPEINDNEREYLKLINYDLHLKQETFENWSRVVLLLSRISKLRPGCFDPTQQTSTFEFGPDTMDSAKTFTASPHTCSENPELYSPQWWSGLCKDLNPDIFKDSAQTDTFIEKHIRLDHVDRSTQIPPIPASAVQGSSDMNFSDPFGSRGPASNLSTPVQMAASSPTQITELPIRPQPRKLQTPQSTPSANENAPWHGFNPNSQKSIRCSASVDALRSCMRKQVLSASIDRCPPPQPQPSTTLPPFHDLAKSAVLNQANVFSSSGPSPPQTPHGPWSATPFSHMANGRYRSRSSSISSNSSCSSGASSRYDTPRSIYCPSTTVQPRQLNGQLQPCLISPTGEMLRPLRRKSGFILSGTSISEVNDQAQLNPQAEKGVPAEACAVNDFADAIAASALMDLRVGDRQCLTPQACPRGETPSRDSTPKASLQCSKMRGHKRTISTTNDNLQTNVRQLLQEEEARELIIIEDDSDDSIGGNTKAVEEKQLQQPNRSWARMKRPVSNAQLNKRRALDCGSQQRQFSATERARGYLRQDAQHLVS